MATEPSFPEQWSLPLEPRGAMPSVVVGVANARAIEAVLRDPWVGALYLEGPEACGKTLIADLWAAGAGGRRIAARDLTLVAAAEAVEAPAIAVDALECLPPGGEEALFHLFNALARRGGRLLLTGRLAPRALHVTLPDLRTRLNAARAVAIDPPDDELLARLILSHAERRQLALPDEIPAFLAARMGRTYLSAINVVEALDRLSLERGRAIGRDLAAEALAMAET